MMKFIIALIVGLIVGIFLNRRGTFAHKDKSHFYEAGVGAITAIILAIILSLFSSNDVIDQDLIEHDDDDKIVYREDKKSTSKDEKEEFKKETDKEDKKSTKDKTENTKENKTKDKKETKDSQTKDNKKSTSKKTGSNDSATKKSTTKKSDSNVKKSTGSSTKPSAPSKKPSAPSKKPAQSKPSAPSKKPAQSKPKPTPSKPKPSKPADKVEYMKHQTKEEIYYDTKYEDTNSLYIGEQKVKVKGQNGYIITEYSDKYVNGKWVETTTKVIDKKDKVDEVILSGTKMKKHINDSDSRQIFHEVNAHRKANGVPPLQWDETLYKAAKVRAEELIDTFSHSRPDGTLYSTAIDEAGVVRLYSGENIAAWQGSVNQVMNSWKNSPGHNGNMLNPSYTHMASAKMESSDGNYWVQLFIHR